MLKSQSPWHHGMSKERLWQYRTSFPFKNNHLVHTHTHTHHFTHVVSSNVASASSKALTEGPHHDVHISRVTPPILDHASSRSPHGPYTMCLIKVKVSLQRANKQSSYKWPSLLKEERERKWRDGRKDWSNVPATPEHVHRMHAAWTPWPMCAWSRRGYW